MDIQPEDSSSIASFQESTDSLTGAAPMHTTTRIWARLGVGRRKSRASCSRAAESFAQESSPAIEKQELPAQRSAVQLWRFLRHWFVMSTFTPSWLPRRAHHPLFGYLAAVLLQGAGIAVTLLLVHLFPAFAFPGLLEVLAIVLVAVNWGAGPGLVA